MTTTKRFFMKPLALHVLAALGASMMILLASQAQAATFTVANTSDTGDGSLRQAIIDANTTAGADTIDFAPSLSGQTITLASQLPTITDTAGLTIDGGSADITIDGGNAVRLFFVASGAKLSLNELTLTRNQISDGSGGAIRNEGMLEVSNSTLSGNTTSNDGGAISNVGTLTVSDSTFSGNSAGGDGGGIFNDGTLEVNNSTFSGNSSVQFKGGAIANRSSGTATVTNSTFFVNSAGGEGGAISNERTLEATNSTFSGNSASTQGGGIWNQSETTLTVTNSTFSANSADAGGGIFNDSGAVTLKNTIVADSPSGGDCFATPNNPITDAGYNLIEVGNCITEETSLSVDPMLGPLADNGGPTRTHALLAGSPAINAIPQETNGCGTDITQDQRGVSRPQGSACDIGAFEFGGTAPPSPALSISDRTVAEGNSGTSQAVFTVSLSEASMQTITVDYVTTSETATAGGVDYQAAGGTLTFAPGVTTQTVSVQVNGDTLYELDETFFVNLSNPANATISDAKGIGTITNDDQPPDTTVPMVSTTSPGDNGTMGKADLVTATFSEEVKGISAQTFFLKKYTLSKNGRETYVPITAKVTTPNGITAVLNPTKDLARGTYQATISNGVTDKADNALVPKTWKFSVTR
jgi:predicted outer membrane repeat protein